MHFSPLPHESIGPRGLSSTAGLVFFSATLILSACSGGVDTRKTPTPTVQTLSGFVGSPSLTDATVTVMVDGGATTVSARSKADARYTVSLDRALAPPIRVQVAGGTDLMTGQENDAVLSVVSYDQSGSVSVSYFSTLATKMAACRGNVTDTGLDAAWSRLRAHTGLAYLAGSDPLGASQLGQLMRANMALAETGRRTRTALNAIGQAHDLDQVLGGIACDLADDGLLNASEPGTSPRLASVFRAAQAAVLTEMIGGAPHLDGQQADVQIDETLRKVSADPNATLAHATIPEAMLGQARSDLALLQEVFEDQALTDLAVALAGGSVEAAFETRRALNATRLTALWSLPERVALADDAQIERLADAMRRQPAVAVPVMSLSADRESVSTDESVTLSWASSDARRCLAAEGWQGNRPPEGTFTTGPLGRTAEFRLYCSGLGGVGQAAAQVSVIAQGERPVVSLGADDPTPDTNQGTMIRWSSSNATACSASGAWTGDRAVVGRTYTGSLTSDADFTLSCTGPGGTDSATLRITVTSAPEPTPAPEPEPTAEPTPEPEPAPAPQVSLTAASSLVNSGGSTTLTWNASNASTCTASGGWSGSRATAGSANVGPINQQTTFSLSCSGSGGSALAMVSISVRGSIGLSWVAPTENVDGSALTDLAGYRVYYGATSRAYTDMTEVSDPGATATTLALPSGDYYVAMTALDGEGNESAYSNEVRKSVP